MKKEQEIFTKIQDQGVPVNDRTLNAIEKDMMMDESIINTMRVDFLSENFVSHSDEPQVGDAIVNNNPKCKHFESEGIVIKIESLPGEKGKTATYKCTNSGDNWDVGDLLTKTMDQITPREDLDNVVVELMQSLLPTENPSPEDQLRAVIDEMIKVDGPGSSELIITSPHEAYILDEEYITAVLGLQIPLNEAYPYTAQFRQQVLHEQHLIEGFFSGLAKMSGQSKTLMAAIGTIIKDKAQIGDFVKRIKKGVIDEPLEAIRDFLGSLWEKLKEWGMKAFEKIADGAKKVLEFLEKQVKKIFGMGGWSQALAICGLALALAFIWKEIKDIVTEGNVRLKSFGKVMVDLSKGAIKSAGDGMDAVKVESIAVLPALSDAVYANEYRLDEFGFLSALFGDDEQKEEPTEEEVAEIDKDGDGKVTSKEVEEDEKDPEKQKEKKQKNKDRKPGKVGLAIAAGDAIPKDGVFLSLDQAKEAGIEGKTKEDVKAAKTNAAVAKADAINKKAKTGEKGYKEAEKAYEENKGDTDAVVKEMPKNFKEKVADFLKWCKENILGTVVKFVKEKIMGAAKAAATGALSGGAQAFITAVTSLYGGIKFVSKTLAPHLKGFGKDVKSAVADVKKDPEAVADDLESVGELKKSSLKSVGESVIRGIVRESLVKKKTKVRGYLKPASSFHSLAQWEAVVSQLLKLQKEGVDTRGGKIRADQRLLSIISEYFGYLLSEEVPRWEHLTTKNVLDFIEDFVNHRFWGLEKEFGHYFPDISRLKFAYFYSRGDIEPYVLLDEEYTTQIYGSTHNPKELLHYTSAEGLQRLSKSIQSGQLFDISTFTVAERPFFRPESNIIVHLKGNVRAGFRSDIKSMAVDSGRRACNLYRLEYPGKDVNNICDELESCDGDVRTSLWNEYIATPVEILDVYEMVSEG